ncbi:ATP-binding protein [Hathewaya histolytica]|uniref:sensor histidine kinase n=1 Tax=Hathewaya histolytica TaxID=1498 RepID=UPI003B679FDA
MKKLQLGLTFIVIFFLIFNKCFNTFALENNSRYKTNSVLYISSYYLEHPIAREVTKGINDSLKDVEEDVYLYTEYLDVRLTNKKNKDFKQYLKQKYEGMDIDLVIVSGEKALEFTNKNIYNIVDKKTPIVFCGVKELEYQPKLNFNNYAGITEKLQLKSTFNLALSLDKKLKNAIFLTNSKTRLEDNKEYNNIKNTYKDKVKINIIKEDNLYKCIDKIKSMKLNKNSAIFFQGDYFDNDKKYLSTCKTINILNSSLNIPIYSYWFSYQRIGILGGDMVSPYKQGIMCGNLTKKILRDGKNENYIIDGSKSDYNTENYYNYLYTSRDESLKTKEEFKNQYKYMINYNILNRYKLFMGNIKNECEILNPPSKYEEKNKKLIILIWVITIVCTIIMIILIFNLITKSNIKRKMQKKEEMLEEIKIQEKLKNDFFANISHEFRTPLNLIFSSIQLIEFETKGFTFNYERLLLKSRVNTMKYSCYRLLRLTNNFIKIIEIENGLLKTNMTKSDIVSSIEDISMEVGKYLEERDSSIKVLFDTEIEESVLNFDKDNLEKILLNIISNSVKFSKENSTVEVFLRETNNHIHINIKDDGIGIPKEKVNFIFNKFSQVNKSLNRSKEGAGIGLFIVKGLLYNMGGDFSVNSEENIGTNFNISLPIKNLEEERYIGDNISSLSSNIIQDHSLEYKVKVEFSDIYI